MTFILCCSIGTADSLAPPLIPPAILGSAWIATAGAYNSWATAVDYCVAQGGEDLCPWNVYCETVRQRSRATPQSVQSSGYVYLI